MSFSCPRAQELSWRIIIVTPFARQYRIGAGIPSKRPHRGPAPLNPETKRRIVGRCSSRQSTVGLVVQSCLRLCVHCDLCGFPFRPSFFVVSLQWPVSNGRTATNAIMYGQLSRPYGTLGTIADRDH